MEAANRGASEAKGENIGLGISLPKEQGVNSYVTRKLAFEFHYFFTRKFWFLYLAKAMVIMPGGFGTLEELLEMITWQQLGYHKKPVGVLNVGGYFDPLLEFFDRSVECGFVRKEARAIVVVGATPDELLEKLETAAPRQARGMSPSSPSDPRYFPIDPNANQGMSS